MLQGTARLAIAAPRRIVAIAVLVFIAAAILGVPVAKSLAPGGFQDPDSESARAIAVLTDKFGQSGQQMLILLTAPAGAGSEQARNVGTELVDQLQRSPLVYNVSSPWTGTPAGAAAALVMSMSFAALIAAHVSFMRMFGLGLTLAVFADATLVRMVLVPAFVHLMGRRKMSNSNPSGSRHSTMVTRSRSR